MANQDGTSERVEVRFWNDTVANLTVSRVTVVKYCIHFSPLIIPVNISVPIQEVFFEFDADFKDQIKVVQKYKKLRV